MERFTKKELDEMSELELAFYVIDERLSRLASTTSPLSQKLVRTRNILIQLAKAEREGRTVDAVVQYAIDNLNGMQHQLYGGEERPNDLMDCGVIDGSYNTYIDILNFFGVKHNYKEQ